MSDSQNIPSSGGKGFKKQSAAMAAGVMGSRVSGLVREQVLAYFFGASAAMEAFVAAYRIPNLLRDLVAENVSTSAFLPTYAKTRQQSGAEGVKRYSSAVLTLLVLGSLAVAGIGIIFAEPIVSLVAPGFRHDAELYGLTVSLTRWLFPYLIFISAIAFLQSVQNAEGRFFIPALATAGCNAGVIIFGAALAFFVQPPIIGMAWGVLIGGALTLFMLLPGYVRFAGVPRLVDFRKVPEVSAALKLAVPVVFGAAAANINVLVGTIVASFAENGAIAYLNYSYRVMFLPLGLIAVSLSTVALSNLSRSHHSGDEVGFRTTLERAVNLSILLSLPAAAGLIFLSHDVIGVLFNYGQFGDIALKNTALALVAYTIGVPAFSLNRVYSSVFYSRSEASTAVKNGVAGVVLNIALNLIVLQQGAGFFGIALAASVSGWFQALLNAACVGRIGFGFLGTANLRATIAALIGIAAMIGALLAAADLFPEARIIRVPLEIGVAAAVYCGAAWCGVRLFKPTV